jgi:hypothetical protein
LWKHDRINLVMKENSFIFKVNNSNWTTKLGGTSILYFLLSYHYGLISLTNQPECHFPGFLAIDLPATFMDGSIIRDKENFIAEPFVNLLNRPEMKDCQVIISGQSFEGLENVNRITLSTVWI